jgi:hypothetical protein
MQKISKEALFMLALQLSYLTSNAQLMMLPHWLDSISNEIYIGYDEQGLSLQTKEFGIVSLPTFCSKLKESYFPPSKGCATTTAFPVKLAV